MSAPVVLLGPQRPNLNLQSALHALDVRGSVVCITAGQRLDEADDATLRRELHPQAVSLPIYGLFERIASVAPDLAHAYKERQNRVRKLKALYRVRLHAALSVVRRLIGRKDDDPELVRLALDAAVLSLREIDSSYLGWSDAAHGRFDSTTDPRAHPRVASVRARARAQLLGAGAVVIQGGHVGVLRNRLDFFGLGELLVEANQRGVPIIASAGGAMALTDRVVLFHDDPPHGVGDPEILDRGLGVVPGLVLFPDAAQRLRLDDRARVAALARRFGPAACLALESGAVLARRGGVWRNEGASDLVLRFGDDGGLSPVGELEGGADAANS